MSGRKGIKVLLTLSTARGERECKTEGVEQWYGGISDERREERGRNTIDASCANMSEKGNHTRRHSTGAGGCNWIRQREARDVTNTDKERWKHMCAHVAATRNTERKGDRDGTGHRV